MQANGKRRRRPGWAWALLLAAAVWPIALSAAAQGTSAVGTVRYHFGDDARWSAPGFDDSGWAIAADGQFHKPAVHSDGFVWVRVRLAVPANAGEPLGVRLVCAGCDDGAEQVFVNGDAAGEIGSPPPGPRTMILPASTVFPVPADSSRSATTTVAIRFWYGPLVRYEWSPTRIEAQLGSRSALELEQHAGKLDGVVGWIPVLALNALLAVVGLGLLGLWGWLRRRELLWFALLLVFYGLQEFLEALPALTGHVFSGSFDVGAHVLANVLTMVVTVEFLWIIFNLRGRWLRVLLHAAWIVFNVAQAWAGLATSASGGTMGAIYVMVAAVTIFNIVTLLIELRFLVSGPNRAIALGMAAIPIGSSAWVFHIAEENLFGIPHLDLFNGGCLVAGFFLAVMLVRRAVGFWRESSDLRVEFEAAREVQERLVTAPPEVPGFRIASVYAPAKQVGGDFYAIRALDGGGVQIVVGDVSGKGLRAAMTVSAVVGVLRAMPVLAPARVLADLNRSLMGSVERGFVTCCVARIDANGGVTIANAGHLAPYRNGEEMEMEPGLPLGITAETAFEERRFTLAAGDTLTFLSDGVVEARSASGELFGFERTRQISGQAAEEIAQAAQDFGQEDDITVLTLAFAGAEVAHA